MKLLQDRYLLKLVLIASLVLALRYFCIDVFYIPSSSMEDTLLPGDFVVVNKLSDKRLNASGFSTTHYERGDIVTFYAPYVEGGENDVSQVFIKRCIGVPGDTIKLEDGKATISHIKFERETIKTAYKTRITTNACYKKLQRYFDGNVGTISNEGVVLNLTPGRLDTVKRYCFENFEKLLGYSKVYNSTGHIIIPTRGRLIPLNARNYDFYRLLIRVYENKETAIRNDSVFIDGVPVQWFVFSKDYYFLLGDNRSYSNDSRAWGLIPHDLIIGKAFTVIASKANPSGFKFRSDRLLVNLK